MGTERVVKFSGRTLTYLGFGTEEHRFHQHWHDATKSLPQKLHAQRPAPYRYGIVRGHYRRNIELCPPPPGMSGAVFANRIRDEMRRLHARHLGLFKVFTTAAARIPQPFRTELQNSGVQICEGDGSTIDKIRRTADILTWGLTGSHQTVILFITNDPDFAPVISALRNRGCHVSLLLHPDAPSSVLLDYAADVLEWRQVFNQESSDHSAEESSLDSASSTRGVAHSIRQSEAGPLEAPGEIEHYHPPAVPQDPLSSAPQTQSGESLHQESEPSSSSTGHSQISETDQTTSESSAQQMTLPNPPPLDFEPFKHLVQVLQELDGETSQWHAWSTVSNRLVELDPEVFKKLGYRRFRPYIQVASKEANIVSIKEPKGGDGEVSLNAKEAWNVTFE